MILAVYLLDGMVPETTTRTALLGDVVVSIDGKWSLDWHGNDATVSFFLLCYAVCHMRPSSGLLLDGNKSKSFYCIMFNCGASVWEYGTHYHVVLLFA